jgi:hypothetical protein
VTTPRMLWSLSALAAEFGLDRRTVAQRMAAIPPDGLLRRNAAWFLETGAPVPLGRRGNGADPADSIAKRAGGPFSVSQNPIDESVCTVLAMLAARLPAEAAMTAIRAGASEELAREVFKGFAVRTCALVDELTNQLGIAWASDAHFDLPPPPDWRAFRERDNY